MSVQTVVHIRDCIVDVDVKYIANLSHFLNLILIVESKFHFFEQIASKQKCLVLRESALEHGSNN